jgi:hypothetical protein
MWRSRRGHDLLLVAVIAPQATRGRPALQTAAIGSIGKDGAKFWGGIGQSGQ